MKWIDKLDKQSITPTYQQIENAILKAIETGNLKIGDRIPSIHKICGEFALAPGTVIRAYEELREMGIILSKQGKGFYVASTEVSQKTKIFLLFDRMTAFKEILYDSFRREFDENTDIQVFFHHYDAKRFDKLIRENLGKFSHYVLMPHLEGDIRRFVQRIPEKKLVFIDNFPKSLKTLAKTVYQDFYRDIYQGLEGRAAEVGRYKSINLSLSKSDFQFVPAGTRNVFLGFCKDFGLPHKIIQSVDTRNLQHGELYIIFDDGELISTLKAIEKEGWQLKRDIGIISFDEAPMKSLLAGGISVLSTDFELMGKTAARMVKGEIQGQIANPFQLIYRNSF